MAARTTKPKPPAKSAHKKTPKPAVKAPALAKARRKKAATRPTPKAKAKVTAKKAAPRTKAGLAARRKATPALKARPKAKRQAAVKARTQPEPKTAKRSSKSNLAREALKARAMKKAIAELITPIASGAAVVDAYMRDVDHPFKAEMQAVRGILLGASPKVAERIKWNAPSFYYKEDLAAFNPRATEYAHLILLFPGGSGLPAKSPLLEGKQKDRREAKFFSLADVESKRPALEKLVRNWVALRDA